MEQIPLSERVSNLENFSADQLVELRFRLQKQCLGVKILVAAVAVLAVVAVALSVTVARLVAAPPQSMQPAIGAGGPPMNISWVSAGKDIQVYFSSGSPPPTEKPKAGGFELEYQPGDPRLPTYQYPGCALYCNLVQCSCPL